LTIACRYNVWPNRSKSEGITVLMPPWVQPVLASSWM